MAQWRVTSAHFGTKWPSGQHHHGGGSQVWHMWRLALHQQALTAYLVCDACYVLECGNACRHHRQYPRWSHTSPGLTAWGGGWVEPQQTASLIGYRSQGMPKRRTLIKPLINWKWVGLVHGCCHPSFGHWHNRKRLQNTAWSSIHTDSREPGAKQGNRRKSGMSSKHWTKLKIIKINGTRYHTRWSKCSS